MALNQTNKLVWIVETIYRAHKDFLRGTEPPLDGQCGSERRRGDVEAHLPQVEVEYLRHLWLVNRMRKDSTL